MLSSDKDFLLSLSKKYYALAFNLIPDELQAGQLLVDALHRVGLESLSDHLNEEEGELSEERFIRALYQLARKRIHHQVAPKQKEAYFHLNLLERAVLYLSHRKHMEAIKMADALGERPADIVGVLQSAREKLLKMNGLQFQL